MDEQEHSARDRAVLGRWNGVGRAVAATASVALFASLFLSWSDRRPGNFLALYQPGWFAFHQSRTAWEVYAIADIVLAVVAGLVATAAVVNRVRLTLATSVAALAGLIFAAVQLGDPPRLVPASELTPALMTRFTASATPLRTTGVGEVVAVVALVVAIVGLLVSLQVTARGRAAARMTDGPIRGTRPATP